MSSESEVSVGMAEFEARSQNSDDTLVVLEFSPKAPPETKEWLMALIRSPVSSGGADLKVKLVPNSLKNCDTLHLSSETKRLLIGAEKLKVKKPRISGISAEFCLQMSEEFQGFTNGGEGFLTLSECERIIFMALQHIKPHEDGTVPGYSDVKLHKGRAIIPKCLTSGIVTQIFPLHDREKLKALEHKWYLSFNRKQPLDSIRDYFGETIALYFGFLSFYSVSLVPPVLLVVVFALSGAHEQTKNTVFAILNLIWATVFLEAWKRRCAEISFKWGTLTSGMTSEQDEEPRPQYWGTKRLSPITGEMEQYYPSWKRNLKVYCVSYPIVVLCMILATVTMLLNFKFLHAMEARYSNAKGIVASVMLSLPSVVYAVAIAVLNNLYHQLATFLTESENHRLQSSFDNHLIVKLVLFYFVNCFSSLFYIAFYLQDIELLQKYLAALMITSQLIGQVTESLIPYIMFRSRVTKVSKEGKKIVMKTADLSDDIERQGTQEQYLGTFYDYLELFLQFGYTFLFSSAYPMAAFWALLNNVIEMRTDAFKMCRIYQRPFAETANSIGAWQVAFEALSVIAVITNCALIGLAAKSAEWLPEMTTINAVLMFVAIEHFLLGVKFVLALVIPDVPQWVQDEMARQQYKDKLSLRTQGLHSKLQKFSSKETLL
ncbi:anoctamin-10-like [Acropora palmata]|uniref:anoctamin-10-like n=1 Tax=Acropora palmata TaxID=6131 RepID=UPI003DA1835A